MKVSYETVMELIHQATTDDGVTSWTDYLQFTKSLNEHLEGEQQTETNLAVKRLRLKKGDILLVQKSFSPQTQLESLMKAGKYVKEDVPIVFVDEIDGIKVLEIDETMRPNSTNPGLASDKAE